MTLSLKTAAVGSVLLLAACGTTTTERAATGGLAGAAIGGARRTYKLTETNAPLRSNATLEAVGGTAVYLASDYGACTTGEIIRVDGGFHILGMPQPENL